MKLLNSMIFVGCMLIAIGCTSDEIENDAFGNFEAIEVLVSAEGSGKIMDLIANEGARLEKGERVGLIDTIHLYLQKKQLLETIEAIKAKVPDIPTQIAVFNQKLIKLEYEKNRIERLVKSEVATTKQLDDIKSEIAITKKQLIATKTSLNTQQKGILAEISPIEASIAIIDEMIRRSIIVSPINGVVLTKFAHAGELTTQGKPLFKIADMDTLICRAYVSEPQLGEFKIGGKVTVLTDNPNGGLNEYFGIVTWVSNKAEFTPKVIQTKDIRVNLVYAIKIAVKNGGELKIGMPAEVKF